MKLTTEINAEILQDLISIETGLYRPLDGALTAADYTRVVHEMRLSDGSVWPLPITIDVDHDAYLKALDQEQVYLTHHGKEVGYIEVRDAFKVDLASDIKKVFKTSDDAHPGVKKERVRSVYRIGGKTHITDKTLLAGALDPQKTKKIFKDKGWKTIVGFQTRNPIHCAHEHLQRAGLELCDGLFINPSVGWKKPGDFTEEAVFAGYDAMITEYYPKDRVHIEGLRVSFRYAGPREAIFHAILRRNLGCTHFIIGRDHAGVGTYYGTYEAHDVARGVSQEADLGITLLLFHEPYFCKKCDQVVTEKHCGHTGDAIERISGTRMREALYRGELPDPRFMRPEVAQALINLQNRLFITDAVTAF